MNIIAPCPKKPTSLLQQDWNSSRFVQQKQDEMVDDACFELRQILQQSQGHYRHYCTTASTNITTNTTTTTTTATATATNTGTTCFEEHLIPRTNNPLPLDSSFVPILQSNATNPMTTDTAFVYYGHSSIPPHPHPHRPRSLSVGDSRPVMNLVH